MKRYYYHDGLRFFWLCYKFALIWDTNVTTNPYKFFEGGFGKGFFRIVIKKFGIGIFLRKEIRDFDRAFYLTFKSKEVSK